MSAICVRGARSQMCSQPHPARDSALDGARKAGNTNAIATLLPGTRLTLVLAHLSDPHVGPLPAPSWRDLIGKRLTGYWNWHSHRHDIHNMAVLAAIVDDIAASAADHIALTGDLVNLGLGAEFPLAAHSLAKLGGPDQVSIVPGNHDAYVAASMRHMAASFASFMAGDDGVAAFPYLRRRGGIALIGLSSAIPTLPFLAEGAMGKTQLAGFEAMLAACHAEGLPVVVMIHHPPHHAGARLFRRLRDAAALEAILARHGASLVLHGHNHKYSLAELPGPNGTTVPVVGVASASAVPGDAAHRAAWHLFRLTPRGKTLAITLDVRGMAAPGAPVTLLDSVTIR